MLDKYKVGFKFLDYQCNEQMIWGLGKCDGKECYIVNDANKDDDRVHGYYYSDDDIDKLMLKQDALKDIIKRRLLQENADKELEEKALQARIIEEDLQGFDDGLSAMQRGRAIKVLLKKFRYDGVVMSRKEHIIERVKEGCTFEVKTFSNAYSKRATTESSTGFYCTFPDNVHLKEITKTEFDFANYLIKKEAGASIHLMEYVS